MTFYIGQKVQCISAKEWVLPTGEKFLGNTPELNKIYTISGFDALAEGVFKHPYFYFWEISNAQTPGGEASFAARLFRPLDERKTNISIFTKMLVPDRVNA